MPNRAVLGERGRLAHREGQRLGALLMHHLDQLIESGQCGLSRGDG